MPHSISPPTSTTSSSPNKLSKPRPAALQPAISPPRKRFSIVRTHARSKSLNLIGMTLPPLPTPSPSPSPSPMPLVIPEGKSTPTFTTTPPTPTTPRRTTSPTSSAFPSQPPSYLVNELYTPSTSPSTTPRSRSPSVSSLETIPDSPDAEAEAEAEVIVVSSRRSMDIGGTSPISWGREKRKRWSVCGAEKRADLELETIWEDAPARKEEEQDRVD